MVGRVTESSSDYVIKSVKIRKFNTELEVRNVVEEINIFENIELPYLTGAILFKDDNRIFDSVGFDGVEEVDIIISQPGAAEVEITKNFIVRSVSDTKKTSDLLEIISLNLIEKRGYDGMLEKFSKAYTGSPIEIIEKIVKEKFEDLELQLPKIQPIQKKMKIVIPYLNPWDAIAFILKKASTEDGLPYYIYSSLNSEKLIIKSLEEMITSESWNKDSPFRYSKAYIQSSSDPDTPTSIFNVEAFETPSSSEDTLKLVLSGAVGAKFNISDVVTGRQESGRLDMQIVFAKLKEKNIISRENIEILTPNYANNQLLTEKNSFYKHIAVMSNTYDDYPNYYQEEEYDEYRKSFVRQAFEYLIFKSAINITLPGYSFLQGSDNTVGSRIKYFHMNNDLAATENPLAAETEFKDVKRSGDYTIYSTKHVFYATRHRMHVTAVKLGRDIA